jgi:hypothetical protein
MIAVSISTTTCHSMHLIASPFLGDLYHDKLYARYIEFRLLDDIPVFFLSFLHCDRYPFCWKNAELLSEKILSLIFSSFNLSGDFFLLCD